MAIGEGGDLSGATVEELRQVRARLEAAAAHHDGELRLHEAAADVARLDRDEAQRRANLLGAVLGERNGGPDPVRG